MRYRTTRTIALAAVAALVIAACGGDSADDASGEPAGEPAAEGVQCEVGQVDGDLYLYNWSEYIDPELKDEFAAEYGVEVFEDNYDSNEAMQPIIAAGGSGYDVIVPSDYMVSIMIEEGTLAKLDLDAAQPGEQQQRDGGIHQAEG